VRPFALLIAWLFLAAAPASAGEPTLAAAPAPADDPVAVDGARFVSGGKPFAFVGANVEVMHGSHARAAYEATLEAAHADGLSVVRVWALGEGAADAPAWARESQLFRAGPDVFLDVAYQQLDRVLAAAKKKNLRVILTLANHWADYGGVPMYLAWAGLPVDGWGAHDRFFSDERTRGFYRAHLSRLLERTNSVNGVRYADDATIFAWELINESQVETPDGARARRAFIDEMSQLVKSRAPRQLVTPGLMGYGTRKEREEWLSVCRLPSIDYCDSHLYPQTSDAVPSLEQLQAFIDDRVQLAHHVAHKPLVFGEFGFDTRGANASWLGRGRTAWFSDFIDRVFFDGAAGALVWIYQPWSGKERDFGIYVDRPDTDDVRGALKAAVARLSAAPPGSHNPRLSATAGDALLYDPYHTVEHADAVPRVVRQKQQVTVELDPLRFSAGRFERVGSWDGGALPHAYGAGDGWLEWRFTTPPGRARSVELAARLSSEFPGMKAPPDGGSRVSVRVDGVEQAALDVIPDDGLGRIYQVRLRRLRPGPHTLRLSVESGPQANGLCVYGGAPDALRLVFRR
jgi:hypothetical protein